jgi:hypothetical protein
MDYLSEVLSPSENEHTLASLEQSVVATVETLQDSLLANIDNLIDAFIDDYDDELSWVYFGVGGPA